MQISSDFVDGDPFGWLAVNLQLFFQLTKRAKKQSKMSWCSCLARDRRSLCHLSMAASLLMILLAVTILLASGPTDARPNSVTSPWKDSYGLGPAAAVVAAAHKGEASKVCEPDHLTVYRVIVNTFWNDRLFPKHFPQWRPPAQWTKLVGQFSCT